MALFVQQTLACNTCYLVLFWELRQSAGRSLYRKNSRKRAVSKKRAKLTTNLIKNVPFTFTYINKFIERQKSLKESEALPISSISIARTYLHDFVNAVLSWTYKLTRFAPNVYHRMATSENSNAVSHLRKSSNDLLTCFRITDVIFDFMFKARRCIQGGLKVDKMLSAVLLALWLNSVLASLQMIETNIRYTYGWHNKKDVTNYSHKEVY